LNVNGLLDRPSEQRAVRGRGDGQVAGHELVLCQRPGRVHQPSLRPAPGLPDHHDRFGRSCSRCASVR
jgi:hypothetical protein